MKGILIHIKEGGSRYGIFLAVLAFTFSIFYFHGYPLWQDIVEMREEVEGLERALEERVLNSSPSTPSLPGPEGEGEGARRERGLENLDLEIYSEDNLPELFSRLEGVLLVGAGENYGMTIGEISSWELPPSQEGEGEEKGEDRAASLSCSSFTLEVSFSASLEEILLYLNRLEKDFLPLRVEQMELKDNGEYYSLSLTLKALLWGRGPGEGKIE